MMKKCTFGLIGVALVSWAISPAWSGPHHHHHPPVQPPVQPPKPPVQPPKPPTVHRPPTHHRPPVVPKRPEVPTRAIIDQRRAMQSAKRSAASRSAAAAIPKAIDDKVGDWGDFAKLSESELAELFSQMGFTGGGFDKDAVKKQMMAEYDKRGIPSDQRRQILAGIDGQLSQLEKMFGTGGRNFPADLAKAFKKIYAKNCCGKQQFIAALSQAETQLANDFRNQFVKSAQQNGMVVGDAGSFAAMMAAGGTTVQYDAGDPEIKAAAAMVANGRGTKKVASNNTGGGGTKNPPSGNSQNSGGGGSKNPPANNNQNTGGGGSKNPPASNNQNSGGGGSKNPPASNNQNSGGGGSKNPPASNNQNSGGGGSKNPPANNNQNTGGGGSKNPPANNNQNSGGGGSKNPPANINQQKPPGNNQQKPPGGQGQNQQKPEQPPGKEEVPFDPSGLLSLDPGDPGEIETPDINIDPSSVPASDILEDPGRVEGLSDEDYEEWVEEVVEDTGQFIIDHSGTVITVAKVGVTAAACLPPGNPACLGVLGAGAAWGAWDNVAAGVGEGTAEYFHGDHDTWGEPLVAGTAKGLATWAENAITDKLGGLLVPKGAKDTLKKYYKPKPGSDAVKKSKKLAKEAGKEARNKLKKSGLNKKLNKSGKRGKKAKKQYKKDKKAAANKYAEQRTQDNDAIKEGPAAQGREDLKALVGDVAKTTKEEAKNYFGADTLQYFDTNKSKQTDSGGSAVNLSGEVYHLGVW